jgi:hypothetical protein
MPMRETGPPLLMGALYCWLIEQRSVLANPFARVKVRGAERLAALDASHALRRVNGYCFAQSLTGSSGRMGGRWITRIVSDSY